MITCHLLVVGSASSLKSFVATGPWPAEFHYLELLETSPVRRFWQFEVARISIPPLRELSLRYPRLTFVVDYDDGRTKGIVVSTNDQVRRCQLRYRR